MGVSFPFAVIVLVFGFVFVSLCVVQVLACSDIFLFSERYVQTCLSPFAEINGDGRWPIAEFNSLIYLLLVSSRTSPLRAWQ